MSMSHYFEPFYNRYSENESDIYTVAKLQRKTLPPDMQFEDEQSGQLADETAQEYDEELMGRALRIFLGVDQDTSIINNVISDLQERLQPRKEQ